MDVRRIDQAFHLFTARALLTVAVLVVLISPFVAWQLRGHGRWWWAYLAYYAMTWVYAALMLAMSREHFKRARD